MSFRKYILKRTAAALLALFVAQTILFLVFRVFSPVKDPTYTIANPDFSVEQREDLRRMWGLHLPLYEQYLVYMYNLVTWQYGMSFEAPPRPIAPQMAWRLVNTLSIMVTSLMLSIIIGSSLGVFAASRRGRKSDVLITGAGLSLWGFPTFFIQILFILFFSYYLGFFPTIGVVGTRPHANFLDYFLDMAYHAAGPIITLSVSYVGPWIIQVRSLMVDTLTEDYITTARAKGAKQRVVLYGHAFRSIVPQVATAIVNRFPLVLAGSVITETLFSWPGIGEWYIDALLKGNHPVSQAITYNYAFIVVAGFLVLDLLYGFLDPRIRVGVRR